MERIWIEDLQREHAFPLEYDRALFPEGFVYFDGVAQVDLEKHGFFLFKSHAPSLRHKLSLTTLKPTHPAYNGGSGVGLFAKRPICANEVIGEYGGIACRRFRSQEDALAEKVILNVLTRNTRRDSAYKLETKGLIIDNASFGNELRFINHYEGIGYLNIQYGTRYDADGSEFCAFYAICDIDEGEELLMDYGDDYCKSFKIGSFADTAERPDTPPGS